MKRILVVDDDADQRAVLRAILEAAGYYVATLDRSSGTVDSIKSQQPDLLILDVWMPGDLGGAEVAALVRALGDPVPILFMSALGLTGDQLGGHAFLAKPFDLDALLAKVQQLIGGADVVDEG